MMKQGVLIWITGLPATGKTVIAKEVYRRIKEKHANTVHLDGDNMRSVWGIWAEKSHEGRNKMAMSYSQMCHLLTSQGINVVMSTVSLFHNVQDHNREKHIHYNEIFVETDDDILDIRHGEDTSDRPQKERWKSSTHEYPKKPHLVLKNNIEEDVLINAKKIVKFAGF